MRLITRRSILAMGTVLLLGGRGALADPGEAAAEIARFTRGRSPETGKVTIDLPEIAENGIAAPLSIAVESPMTPDDHVTDALVIADRNPRRIVAMLHFTPMAGRAEAAMRIRLAATQSIIVVAKTSGGALLAGEKAVKVTIGGCGG